MKDRELQAKLQELISEAIAHVGAERKKRIDQIRGNGMVLTQEEILAVDEEMSGAMIARVAVLAYAAGHRHGQADSENADGAVVKAIDRVGEHIGIVLIQLADRLAHGMSEAAAGR